MRKVHQIVTAVAVASAVLLAPGLSGANEGRPAGAATQSAPVTASATPKTTIVIRVKGCRKACTVRLTRFYKGQSWSKTATSRTKTTFTFKNVPRSYTRGMSFEFSDDAEGFTNAVNNVVVRYKGTTTGKRYGIAATKKFRYASGCWAGTTQSKVVLDVTAAWTTGRSQRDPFVLEPFVRTYFSPVLKQLGSYVDSGDGVLENQDVWPC